MMGQDYFINTLGRRTMCANCFSEGVKRLPPTEAVMYQHVGVNKPWVYDHLVFDIDRWGASAAAEEADLPGPSITVVNPENGHAHLFYTLTTGVYRKGKVRKEPQRLYEAVRAAFTIQLEADPHYNCTFGKTPGHSAWETIYGSRTHDLSELAEYITVDVGSAKRHIKEMRLSSANGRNATLFDLLSAWARRAVHEHREKGNFESFSRAVNLEAQKMTSTTILHLFSHKGLLPKYEQRSVARSVSIWTWNRYKSRGRLTDEEFSALQSRRGKQGALKRWGDNSVNQSAAKILFNEGMSMTAIAKRLGVSTKTIQRWLA